MTRFEDAFERYEKHRLTADEAGELLGLSGRHFRRQCARYIVLTDYVTGG